MMSRPRVSFASNPPSIPSLNANVRVRSGSPHARKVWAMKAVEPLNIAAWKYCSAALAESDSSLQNGPMAHVSTTRMNT